MRTCVPRGGDIQPVAGWAAGRCGALCSRISKFVLPVQVRIVCRSVPTTGIDLVTVSVRYLLRQLLVNPAELLPLYQPLLGHTEAHVRSFAAEAIAYLLRKLGQRDRGGKHGKGGELQAMLHAMFIFCQAQADTDDMETSGSSAPWPQLNSEAAAAMQDGIALSLFETVKGVGHRLHSTARFTLLLLFRATTPTAPVSRAQLQVRCQIVRQVMYRLCDHLRSETAEAGWILLHNEVQSATGAWHQAAESTEAAKRDHSDLRLELLLDVLRQWTYRLLMPTKTRQQTEDIQPRALETSSTRKVERLLCSLLAAICPASLSRCPLTPAVSSAAVECVMAVLRIVPRLTFDQDGEGVRQCVQAVAKSEFWGSMLDDAADKSSPLLARSAVYPFIRKLVQWQHFDEIANGTFPFILRHVDFMCASPSDQAYEAIRLLLAIHEACPIKLRDSRNRLQAGMNVSKVAMHCLQTTGDIEEDGTCLRWLALRVLRLVDVPNYRPAIASIDSFRCQLLPRIQPAETQNIVPTVVAPPTQAIYAACLHTQALFLRDFDAAGLLTLLDTVKNLLMHKFVYGCALTLASITVCLESTLATQLPPQSPKWLDQTLLDKMHRSLASPLAPVRVEACRLLRACAQLSNLSSSELDAYTRMVEVANSPLEFSRGREICLEINRLGHSAQQGKLGSACRSALTYFFLGVLKTKFTVLWPAAADALVEELKSQFDQLWPVMYAEMAEMQARTGGAELMLHRAQDKNVKRSAEDGAGEESQAPPQDAVSGKNDDIWTSRCKQDLDKEFADWCKTDEAVIDYVAYHKSLWEVMKRSSSEAERKNRALVDMYLEFLNQYKQLWNDESEADDATEVDAEQTLQSGVARDGISAVSKKVMNASLCDYLALFSTFRNPKGLRHLKQIEASYESLLLKSDPDIQQLALDCLLTVRSKQLNFCKDALTAIICEGTFREALHQIVFQGSTTRKSIAVDGDAKITEVTEEHRADVVPVLVRILYGKLLNRRGRAFAKQSLSTRRTTILSFLACLRSEELSHFVNIALEPFRQYLNSSTSNHTDCDTISYNQLCSQAHGYLGTISLTRRTGVLKMLHDVVRQLAVLVLPYMPQFFRVQLGILQSSSYELDRYVAEPGDVSQRVARERHVELRNLALKQISTINDTFPNCGFEPYLQEFMTSVVPLIVKLPSEAMQAQHPTPVLQCVYTLTKDIHVRQLVLPLQATADKVPPHVAVLFEALINCLDAKNVSVAVLDKVLETIHNTIIDENERQAGYLRPYATLLLEKLRGRIEQIVGRCSGNNRNSKRSVLDTTLLNIVSQLAKITTDKAQLTAIGSMFLPFLKTAGLLSSDEFITVLSVFESIVPMLEQPLDFSVQLSRLLYTSNVPNARKALVAVYEKLGDCVESMQVPVKWLLDLNAWDTGRLDEVDYTRRLSAYAAILEDTQIKAGSFIIPQILPLLYQFFHDVSDADMAIRTSGSSSIIEVVQGLISNSKKTEAATAKDKLINGYVVPMLKLGLRKNDEVARDEFVRLLGAIIRLLPNTYPDLLRLTNDSNPEIDILNNIVHIQLHRRIRSLAQLKDVVLTGEITPSIMMSFLLPLVTHFVYTPSVVVMKGGTRGGKDVVKQGGHNLVSGAIDTIGCMCAHLPWGNYNRVLLSFLHAIPHQKGSEKQVVRLVCRIIDSFHFGSCQSPAPGKANADHNRTNLAKDDTGTQQAIHNTLTKRILPELYRHLTEAQASQMDAEIDGRGIRQPVALAIVKLLQILPQTSLQAQLPRLVTVLANSLKSHMQSIRDESRKTLVHVVVTLGPYYLNFIVEELKTVLLRGYQRHVLAYTIHALLTELAPVAVVGALDPSFESILPVLEDEILGQLSLEKEVDSLCKKTREYKQGKGYDSFKLLAQKLEFSHLPQLLKPVRSALSAATSIRVLSKVEEVLKRIAHGLMVNESATPILVLKFCCTTIAQQQELGKQDNELAVGKKRSYSESSAIVDENGKAVAERSEVERSNAHYITEFALGLVHAQLKRDGQGFKLREEGVQKLLEPYVDLLIVCLESRESKVLDLTLKVFGILIPCQLPAMQEHAKQIVRRVFKVLAHAGDTASLINSCYRCLAIVLREMPAAEVSDQQVRILLRFIAAKFEGSDSTDQGQQNTSFLLLKAILSRKLVSAEVYDAMDSAFKLLIRSHSSSTRTHCSQLLLHFLLEYPLGPKRLARHVEFVVKNLDYSLESGREAALGMLNAIVAKFPAEALMEHIEYIFVAVVVRLVTDDSARCRAGAAALLKSGLQRTLECNRSRYDKLVKFSVSWYQNPKIQLQRAAAQLIGLTAEVEGDAAERHLPAWLPLMLHTLQDGVKTISVAEIEAGPEQWRTLYFTLRSLEKIGQQISGLFAVNLAAEAVTALQSQLWDAVAMLLRHPHAWVKLLCSRLLGAMFSRCASPLGSALDEEAMELRLRCGGVLSIQALEDGLVSQLRSQCLDEPLGEQVVKNLLFVARAYHWVSCEGAAESAGAAGHNTSGRGASDSGQQAVSEAVVEVTHFELLFRRIARLARSTAHSSGEGDGDVNTLRGGNMVHHLRSACCLRWLAAVARMAADSSQSLAAHPRRTEQVLLAVYNLLPRAELQGAPSGERVCLAPLFPPPDRF
jgi:U3 small nucleolar RNA-associated protein 20